METKNVEPTIEGEINMAVLKDSMTGMKALMNKATLKGSFDLDETAALLMCFNNVLKASEQLERCQKTIKQLYRTADQKKRVEDMEIKQV